MGGRPGGFIRLPSANPSPVRAGGLFGVFLITAYVGNEVIKHEYPDLYAYWSYQDSIGPLGNPNYGENARRQIRDCLAQGFTFEQCFGPRKDRKLSENVASADPNDITGPAGVGTERWVPVETPFGYTIRFENMMTATAPAQMVIITHTVDEDLDPATFAFGAFGFSGTTYTVPEGAQMVRERIDLRATLGLFVDVSADFNPVTREVTWQFISIDPETGDLIGDALAGFLPPNEESPEGEGFVHYSIRPNPDTLRGTYVTAQAGIVFDTNDAIETNEWLNRIGEFYQVYLPILQE